MNEQNKCRAGRVVNQIFFLGVWEFHDQHDGTDFETMGQMDKTTE